MSHHLLLVDGPPEPREFCREILERAGYQVGHAATAPDAISQAMIGQPKAILLIASSSALVEQAAGALRQHPATERLPILVINPFREGLPGEKDAGNGMWWIQTPLTPRRLLEKVHVVTTRLQLSRTPLPGSPDKSGLEAEDQDLVGGTAWRDERMRRCWGDLRRAGRTRPAAEAAEPWVDRPRLEFVARKEGSTYPTPDLTAGSGRVRPGVSGSTPSPGIVSPPAAH